MTKLTARAVSWTPHIETLIKRKYWNFSVLDVWLFMFLRKHNTIIFNSLNMCKIETCGSPLNANALEVQNIRPGKRNVFIRVTSVFRNFEWTSTSEKHANFRNVIPSLGCSSSTYILIVTTRRVLKFSGKFICSS